MTEQTQAPEAPQTQIPPMSPEQLNAIKSGLKANLKKAYIEFMNLAMSIPCEMQGLKNAVFFFDTGFFWFEKAIDHMPVVQPQPPQAPQQPTEPPAPPSE